MQVGSVAIPSAIVLVNLLSANNIIFRNGLELESEMNILQLQYITITIYYNSTQKAPFYPHAIIYYVGILLYGSLNRLYDHIVEWTELHTDRRAYPG